jgi:hypothetical protein
MALAKGGQEVVDLSNNGAKDKNFIKKKEESLCQGTPSEAVEACPRPGEIKAKRSGI